MAGDVKIGGGHSSFVYAFVGEAPDKNLRKHAAIFDESDPQTITVYACKSGVKTSDLKGNLDNLLKQGQITALGHLEPDELRKGSFFLVHWD